MSLFSYRVILILYYKLKGHQPAILHFPLVADPYKHTMTKLTKSNSKTKLKSGERSSSPTPTTSSTKSAIKQLPGKIAKKVKHQFHRLDSVLHHVTRPQEHRRNKFSLASPILYPVGIVRAYIPPDQSSTGSVHSRDTWDVKYAKEVDLHSLEPHDTSLDHSIDLSILAVDSSTTSIDMADEHHLPPKEPQYEQDSPTVASPTVFAEAEAPNPFLIDEEGDSLSEGEAVEEQPLSDPQDAVLPTQSVPLDLPSTPQPQTLSNLQKDTPPPLSESEAESVPDVFVPALILPTMFLPIPNVRRPFSSNLLTWWLPRNLMYNTCTRPIL